MQNRVAALSILLLATLAVGLLAVPGCTKSVPKATVEVEWEEILPGKGTETGLFAQTTADGGYVIVSDHNCQYSMGPVPSCLHCDIRVTKTDGNANIEWDENSTQWWPVLSIQQSADQGYLLTTTDRIVQTDSTGKQVWEEDLDSKLGHHDTPFRKTSDGGYISSIDNTLIKTGSGWNEEWRRTFDGIGDPDGISVQQTFDGGFVVASTANESNDIHLIKVDGSGNPEWDKVWKDTSGNVKRPSAQQTSDSGYLLICPRLLAGLRLIKTDASGGTQWDRRFGSPRTDHTYTYSAQETADGGYTIAGLTYHYLSSGDWGDYHLWFMKTDTCGHAEWNASLEGSGDIKSIVRTSDGGYLTVGSQHMAGVQWGIWLMKLKCIPP